MTIIKSEQQIEGLRLSGKILKETFDFIKPFLQPEISTKEIDNLIHKFIIKNNATPAFLHYNGFPASACISLNDEVVHGIPKNNTHLKDGDIISIDIGVNFNGMITDAARTFLVGDVDSEIVKLVDATRQSFFKACEVIKDGIRVGDIGFAIESYIKNFNKENKTNYGIVEVLTGHGVGINLHEDPSIPNYGKSGRGARLYQNMVIAVEPMINLGTKEVDFLNDGWTCKTADRKPSAHYENTILITQNGCELLTE